MSVSAKDSHKLGERAEKTPLGHVAGHPNRNRDGGKAKSSLSPNLVLVLLQLHTKAVIWGEESQLRRCLRQIARRQVSGAFSGLMIDRRRPSPWGRGRGGA